MAISISFVEAGVAFLALLLAVVYYRNKKNTSRNYPPGPPGLPLIGNLLQVRKDTQTKFMKLAEEYGPIYKLSVANLNAIVLSDAKIIQEIFQENSASGRGQNPIFLEFSQGNHGLIMAEGEHWEQQRRFTLRKLRDFGFAKSSMEDQIMDEVNSMIRWFEKRLDKPITGNRIFNGAVVNSLWRIISGEKNEWDAEEKPEMLTATERFVEAMNNVSSSGLINVPFMRFIMPEYFGWTEWLKAIAYSAKVMNVSLERHRKELDVDNPQDLMDHYLVEMKNAKDPKSSFYGKTGEMNLNALIPDLFLAGSETTAHTSSWTLLFLAKNPNVQKKVHEELDRVVGQSRQPTLQDRSKLPYTVAVVMEVLRRSTITINGVPRRLTQDVTYRGYFLPKDALLLPLLYHVHHDPKVWGDPENFRPERFLSEDGTKVVKHESLIPFSLGKRQCLGKSLAEDTLFLFMAGIFQKLKFELDPTDDGADIALKNIKPTTKIINDPEPFRLIVRSRIN